MARPYYVRPSAWDLFQHQVADLDDSTTALLRMATAVSRHEQKTADPDQVVNQIEQLADQVRERAPGGSVPGRLAHLHDLLFRELGFKGEMQRYYDPLFSYLPQVLASRKGIPISLALVYKGVAEGAGLTVTGINAPGHFMVGVQDRGTRMIVDVFDQGRVLSKEEAFGKIEQATGHPVPRRDDFLPDASHRQWLARILLNLRNMFLKQGRIDNVRAMVELEDLLG